MDINKQLFEDVLSGKLKGTFVLRNGKTLDSKYLKRTKDTSLVFKQCYPYALINNLFANSYTENGEWSIKKKNSCIDIVDFIPNTNMKENELKITIPEWQEIDWQESAKQEKIVFRKIDTKPRSWVEYCNLQASKHAKGYFMDSDSNQHNADWDMMTNPIMWRTVLPSKELCNASRAMPQLMSIRDSWIGDWKPNLIDYTLKYCICISYGKLEIDFTQHHQYPLSFPTREMAEDFRNCFKDLLEIAKPFI